MSSPLMSLPRDDTLPGTLAEFVLEFADEERCAALLRRWKYGERGFRCPRCGVEQAWYLPSAGSHPPHIADRSSFVPQRAWCVRCCRLEIRKSAAGPEA